MTRQHQHPRCVKAVGLLAMVVAGGSAAAATNLRGGSPAATSNGLQSSGASSLGCWKDRRQGRVFDAPPSTATTNTPKECQASCSRAGGFKYFGLQNGKQCFCGLATEDYTKHGGSSTCDKNCEGDSAVKCGGRFAMEVFSIGDNVPETTTPSPTASILATPSPTTASPAATPAPTPPVSAATTPPVADDAPAPAPPAATPSPTPEYPAASPSPSLDGSLHEDIVEIRAVKGEDRVRASWGDSYSDGDKCWMSSTFDRGIGEVTVPTPLGDMKVKDLYQLMGGGPGAHGRPLYNDVQCGNGPTKTINEADEVNCPGLVEYGIEGCGQIGPKWDLSGLEP